MGNRFLKLKKGDIEERCLGNRLASEFYKEPWRGYASGPPAVFRMVAEKGISYSEAAKLLFNGEGSFGNGAAMRMAPIGVFYHHLSPGDFYEKVKISAFVTHAHPVGIDGAVVQARAIAIAFKSSPKEEFSYKYFIDELIDLSKTQEIKKKLRIVKALISQDSDHEKALMMLGKSVAVHESMPFSIYSFLKYPGSFKDCLLCAVLNGGDRDTLGAMACSISGAYLGLSRIPEKWVKKIENFSLIKELIFKLYEVHTHYSRI